jgi:hypothetical protein
MCQFYSDSSRFFLEPTVSLSVSKLYKKPDCVTLKPVLTTVYQFPHVKIEVMSV